MNYIQRRCDLKNIFGKPKEGAHSIRLLNFAIVDVILTVLAGWIISMIFKVNMLWTVICLFIIGILLHWYFCVDTTLNKFIYSIF